MNAPIPDPPDISYWDASPALRDLLARKLSAAEFAWAEPQLREMGELAARVVAPLATVADRESPRLVTRTPAGEPVNPVDYHPSYREMERIAYRSGVVAVKDEPATLAAHAS